ncbi:MAG TPA: IS701 family transposase [Acidobacteriaceae bacterium]
MENRLAGWKRELLRAHSLIAGLFARSEARGRSLAYMQGLLSGCERKNGWQMAEWMGEASPYAMQHLLDRASWDADAARDRVREYVVEALGSPEAVLIVDETGFVKKGVHSAGVKRQYSGTAGRIENSQVGVFLCYASDKGAALVDRSLYVPQEWAEDRERCRAAGIPDTVEFATKPELARQMIGRALDAGVPVGWVADDEVYGTDSKVRRLLEARKVSYVLAVASNQHLWWPDFQQQRVDAMAQSLPKRAWKRLSAGSGSKGERLYDWASVRLSGQQGWVRTLLVRRSIGEKIEHAFYLCYAPTAKSTVALLVRVAGQRWQIEQCFQTAKGECGLDHYEVRHWQGWKRHITLAMLAHAVLAVLRGRGEKTLPGGVRLSVPEVRHLLTRLLWHGKHSLQHVLDWSNWRRAHQLLAIFYHYRKQSPLPDCFRQILSDRYLQL